jgi:hypothetical protein
MLSANQISSSRLEYDSSTDVGSRSDFARRIKTHPLEEQSSWLFFRCADFWLASGGASAALLVLLLVVYWHGDRELDALDLVLSELHIGATYNAVIQRRLWRYHRMDVVVIPAIILALTYVLSMSGHSVLITSIAMYAAVWHRGRQSFGVARFYQSQSGGPASRAHNVLFQGAIYLPMVAAILLYTHFARTEYEGEPYLALSFGTEITSIVALAAALWVIVYLMWILRHTSDTRRIDRGQSKIHPGEWWVVVAHTAALESSYALGASNASFLLVLALHHEVQYLYFTYAVSRRCGSDQGATKNATDLATTGSYDNALLKREGGFRSELKHLVCFLVWPLIAFGGAVGGSWLALEWLAPLGVGGLFCHYWLDGRIWTRRSFRN